MPVTPPPTIPIPDPDRIPQRDGSQTQGEYSNNADYWSLALNDSLEGVVDSLEWTEGVANQIEDWANEADASATAAAASATEAEGFADSAAASAASAVNSPGTSATSTSSITPAIGANSFTIAQTGKAFVVGQFVNVVNSPTNFFNGVITAFDSGTGAMTVDARVVESTGSASAWTITPATAAQGQKFDSPVQSFVALGNVTGTTNIDLRVALVYTMTLTGNTTITFTMPSLYTTSTAVAVTLIITKAGAQTLTMPAGTDWHDGAAPTLTVGGTDELLFTKNGSSDWVGSRARKAIA
jgi:hypothetical protein